MKKFTRNFLIIVLATAAIGRANATPYDHIHLTATSAIEAVNWYVKHFGGEAGRFGHADEGSGYAIDRVYYGDLGVIFFEREPTGGSVGTGVDHVGFSMENVEEAIANIVSDGGIQLGDLVEFSGMTIGFVEDPWGTKIELIDDPDLRGTHHLHLSSPNPASTLEWSAENFGVASEQWKGVLPAIDYGNIWLMVAQAQGEVAPTEGRAFDHLGWKFDDLTVAKEMLEGNGVEFTIEPRPYRDIRISFVQGPDGVRIELVEPPK